jgi:hypothetical protein
MAKIIFGAIVKKKLSRTKVQHGKLIVVLG